MDSNRIVVTENICYPSGKLKVEKGAVGTISSRNLGDVGVVFDEGQSVFIEPDGGGRLNQQIPFRATRPADDTQ